MKPALPILAALSVVLLNACAVGRPVPLRQNKEIARDYFEGWANRGDPAVADSLIATDVVLRNPPAVVHGLAAYKRGMAAFHAAFPDLHFTIEDKIAEGNKVVIRWTMRGTHRGDYQGRAASGKRVTVTGISIFQIVNGKIQDIAVNMDRFGQFEQLGWLPASAPAQRKR